MNRIIFTLIILFLVFTKANAGDPLVQGWINLGSGTNAEVSAITKYNGNIVAGGHFTNAGGVNVGFIAQWNGTSWSALGNGVTGLSVEALTVFNGELIAGGEFSNASGVSGTSNIARWNGASWSSLGGGLNDEVKALHVFNGELYAGGSFDGPGGSDYIAKWNGTSWSGLGSGLENQVHAITDFQGNLIVGGRFISAGGVPASRVAQWNGTNWSAINGDNFQDRVFSLAVYNDTLYVGGRFESVGGQSSKRFLVKLAGSTWQQVGGVMEDKVMSMNVFKNELVIGGDFKDAGSLTVYRIAKWNGSSWNRFSTGMDSTVYALYQNISGTDTTLFAGGEFKYVGGRPTNNIAEWSDSVQAYSMEGTVRYASNNQIVTNGYVKAVRKDLNTLGILTLDSAQINPVDGTYRLNRVRGDTVDIIAFPNDVKEYDFTPTYHPNTILWEGSVSINLLSDTTGVDISVIGAEQLDNSGTGTISGEVNLMYTPNGFISPLGYEYRSQSIVYAESGTIFRSFAVSNNDDNYELTSLPAGTYKIIVNRMGYTSDTSEVTLTNGGNVTGINFTLFPNLNPVSVQNISTSIPDNITLYQNYPNPFNPVTNIRFDIKNKANVSMYLYNSLGQVVKKMINNEAYTPGSYELRLDAGELASGIYYYKLITGETSFTKKMVLLK
jgi:hypothetical protein